MKSFEKVFACLPFFADGLFKTFFEKTVDSQVVAIIERDPVYLLHSASNSNILKNHCKLPPAKGTLAASQPHPLSVSGSADLLFQCCNSVFPRTFNQQNHTVCSLLWLAYFPLPNFLETRPGCCVQQQFFLVWLKNTAQYRHYGTCGLLLAFCDEHSRTGFCANMSSFLWGKCPWVWLPGCTVFACLIC